jgi:hypothetical protein
MTEYAIATSVLEAIVRGSLRDDDRLHVPAAVPIMRARPVDVAVEGEQCRVTVRLEARFGEYLPALATAAREKVAGALAQMTGLSVQAVDVIFTGVLPPGARS